jgi:predicted component of type VI protein secretion system
MYLLRLFHRTDPAQPIAAHMLSDGITRVGRDPSADWTIPDPECTISRHHLEIDCEDGALRLRPLGANGVFRSGDGERLQDGGQISLTLGDAVDFGPYRMMVDSVPFATQSGASFDRTVVFAAPFGEQRAMPQDWADASELPTLQDEGSLLEAFCEGAKLDVSALSGEEPAEIMRRAGAIYRQTVLGLGDLINERSTAKANLSLDRTTIGAVDNNPLKWAPTQRLAIDLLAGGETGFLQGPDAIRASFQDVRQHMLGTLAGFDAALRAALELISPDTVASRVEGKRTLLKGHPALCWEEYERVHGEVQAQVLTHRDGPVNNAFLAAYDSALSGLNRDRSDAA